jgi:hypothetical protein
LSFSFPHFSNPFAHILPLPLFFTTVKMSRSEIYPMTDEHFSVSSGALGGYEWTIYSSFSQGSCSALSAFSRASVGAISP